MGTDFSKTEFPSLDRSINSSRTVWEFALEMARQGVWDHNVRLGTVYYSPAWYRMRGFAYGDDVDGELGCWPGRIHPDDLDRVTEITSREIMGRAPNNNFEYRERHRDGRWIWIMSRGQPIEWSPDGEVVRIIGTDTDITHLKLVEKQLAEEKERLQVTMESIADGMISTNCAGEISFMNAAAMGLTGWSLEDARDQHADKVFNIVRPEQGKLALVQSCLEQRRVISLDEDAVLVSRSGVENEIRLTVSPVLSGDQLPLGVVIVFQDATESRATKRELAYSATHDSLTNMPNRSAFNAELSVAAKSALSDGREHALCYLDLDGFKAVNDNAGHAAGDHVLVQLGQLISQSCRAADFAARIGGDEFAILLNDCSLSEANAVCERLIKEIEKQTFTFGRKSFVLSASVGITAVTVHQKSTEELARLADAACYAAKSKGKRRVVVHGIP